MPAHILGIEIGNSLIKLLEVSKVGNYTKIHQFSMLEPPKNSIKDGEIQDIQSLQKLILEELHDKKYQAKKVVVIIQSSQIIYRQIEIKKMSEKAISQWLEVKIEDFLPIKSRNYQLDYKVIGEVKESQTVKDRVLLVATPRPMIAKNMQLIKALHCKPILVTHSAEALAYLCLSEPNLELKKMPGIMVMDIGGKTTHITIISNKGYVLSKVILYGIEKIDREIEQAPKMKDEGNITMTSCRNERIYSQIYYNILKEVKQLLDFFEEHFKCERVAKIYLIGGGSKIKGLRSYIRDALELPTEIMNQLETILMAPRIDFEEYVELFMNLLGGVKAV